MKYFYILSLCLIACSSKTKDKNGYFEGEITYSVSHELHDHNITAEYAKKRSGEKMIYYFKNGNTRKDFYYKGDLFQVRVYNPIENLNSMFYPGWDSIYQYTPHGIDFEIVEYTNLPDTTIDGKKLVGIRVESKYKSKPQPNFIYCWYFDKNLKINPDWFKKCKEGNWHQLMADIKSLPYFYTIDDRVKYKSTFKTEEIKQKSISDSKFDLPDLPIQKID
ncbi:MAG: hypothetical protein ACXWDO_03110 [Bacteroidia bacterium]